MANVYLSLDTSLNKQWAIKEIEKEGKDPKLIRAALKEANLMKNLDHETLPRIVEIFEDERAVYVVMDYIDGKSLSSIIKKYGPVKEKRVVEWAKKLTDTLIYLHSKTPAIIHRDLKPGNIMLSAEGNIKLIDFGIAREFKEESILDTTYLGTKGYAAPEQFLGEAQTDQRTDIYSLGVTIYTLLTGKSPAKPPYKIYPIRYWDKTLSRGLENIVKTCTKENPNERYQSAKELKYALMHVKEMDEVYIKKQKRRLLVFFSFVVLSFFFLGGSLFMYKHAGNLKSIDYDTNLYLAKNSSNNKEKQAGYERLIELRPEICEGYLGLVEIFKEDASFSLEEEKILNKKLNLNINLLKDSEDYGVLAYEIGKLYWYYYDYGNDSDKASGIRPSVPWFEDATERLNKDTKEYKIALIYKEIGKFNRDITLNINEAEDTGLYKIYFTNLKNLLEASRDENNEIVRLSAIRLILSSLNTYGGKFKQDGVGFDDLIDLFNLSKSFLESTPVTTERTINLKNELIQRTGFFKENIYGIYERS